MKPGGIRATTTRTKPRILTVANYKGGTGKTTIAVHLAAALGKAGQRVAIVDASPVQTASQWCAHAVMLGSPIPAEVVALSINEGLRTVLLNQARRDDVDVVVVDCPSHQSEAAVTLSAVALSDLLLVPTPPRSMDIETTERLLADVVRAMGAAPAPLVRLVPTLVDRALLGRVMLKRIEALPFPPNEDTARPQDRLRRSAASAWRRRRRTRRRGGSPARGRGSTAALANHTSPTRELRTCMSLTEWEGAKQP